jgi:hypothetical protein
MPDTQRDTTSLLALFADNTSGNISPQDLRDGVVSILGGYGGLRADGSAAQMTGLNATPTKLTVFTHNLVADGANVVPSTANDNVTVNITGNYEVHASVSFDGSGGAVQYVFEVYVGGVATGVRGMVASISGTAHASASGTVAITAGQTVEVRVSTNTGSSVLTARAAQLWLKRAS